MTDITLQHSVQAALDELVAGGGEVGLQAVVMKDGALVAEAQSGVANPASGEPVSPGSLFFAGSTAKGVLSSLVHALVADGTLDYDLRLAEVWPEFAANGKGDVTVRHALMHEAGLPGLPADLTTEQFCDWDYMCGLLAAATPWWPPGTAFGYHAQTFGFLLGETLQRARRASLTDLLQEVLTERLGVADELHFAVPTPLLDRVVRQVPPPGPPSLVRAGQPTRSRDASRREARCCVCQPPRCAHGADPVDGHDERARRGSRLRRASGTRPRGAPPLGRAAHGRYRSCLYRPRQRDGDGERQLVAGLQPQSAELGFSTGLDLRDGRH